MKVNHFITLYNARIKNENNITKDKVIKTIEDLIHPKQYILFDEKLKMIGNVIEITHDSLYPTAERHRQFIISFLSLYTDLEITTNDYDVLCQTKIVDIILLMLESEFNQCNSLMLMCLDDMRGG